MSYRFVSCLTQWQPAPVDPLFYQKDDIYQLQIYLGGHQDLYQKYHNQLAFRGWMYPDWYDVISMTSSKAKGIEALVNHLHYSMEETMAFGDGENDIEMLHAVCLGVAMGNAPQNVKREADMVTTSVDENGIIHALQPVGVL